MQLIKPSFEILACSSIIDAMPYNYFGGWKKLIEIAGRTCYKSEGKITDTSAEEFYKMLFRLEHYSVLEHSFGCVHAYNEDKELSKYLDRGRPGQDVVIGNYRALEEYRQGLWDFRVLNPATALLITPPDLHTLTVKIICDRGVSHELVRHRPVSYSQESTRYCDYNKKGITFIIPPFLDFEPGVYNVHESHPWLKLLLEAELAYTILREGDCTPQEARSVLPNSLKTEIVVTTNFKQWKHIFKMRCATAAHPQMREIMCPLKEAVQALVPNYEF